MFGGIGSQIMGTKESVSIEKCFIYFLWLIMNVAWMLYSMLKMEICISKRGILGFHKIKRVRPSIDDIHLNYWIILLSLWIQCTKIFVRFWNRAGDKLLQVHQVVDLFEGIKRNTTFIDVCGGPGAFSQLILNLAPPIVFG